MKKCKESSLFSYISSLDSEFQPIKCLYIYPLSDRKIQMKIFCLVMRYRLPRFRDKGQKKNVLVPSGVINRPKLTDFYIKRFLLLVHSVARTIFDDSTKNQTSNTWISWSNICKCCIFSLPEPKAHT